jgi:hypothetical protein
MAAKKLSKKIMIEALINDEEIELSINRAEVKKRLKQYPRKSVSKEYHDHFGYESF